MYINESTLEFPVYMDQIRRETRKSIPKGLPPPAPYKTVSVAPQPEYDPRTHRAVQASQPALISGDWLLSWTVEELSEEEQETAFNRAKSDKLDAARQKRWEAETSGITVNGMGIRTDSGSQSRITGMAAGVIDYPDGPDIDFEYLPNEWITLTRPQALAIAQAVFSHVQECFSHHKTLSQAIFAAENYAELDAVDIDSGWPELT